MNKKRLDYNLRYIASNVGRAQNNVNDIIKYINDEDSIVDVDGLCQHTLENLRHIQRAVSIMMACNNGTMDDFKYKEGDEVWYYDRDKKTVIPTRIVAVLRNTDHYYMLQYDPFTLRHEDNLFSSEHELMAYLETEFNNGPSIPSNY